jgi:hypothetical protein
MRIYGKETLDKLASTAGPDDYLSLGMEGFLTAMTVAAIQREGYFGNVRVSKKGVDLEVELGPSHPFADGAFISIELKASGDPRSAGGWIVKGFTEYDTGGPKAGQSPPGLVLYLIRKQSLSWPSGYESMSLDVSNDWLVGVLQRPRS